MVELNLRELFEETAKLSALDGYVQEALDAAGEGNDVVLTGPAPVWLYLSVAHALHGKAKKLVYRSPVTGDVVIFDHSAELPHGYIPDTYEIYISAKKNCKYYV